MKPAPFAFVAAESVEHAVSLLDEGSLLLAGGQSLLPLLNLRRIRPARLVDINAIAPLSRLRRSDGCLYVGATVRQRTLERSSLVAQGWPLLAQAVRHAGGVAIRARGTVGGSVAQGDPGAQLPVALTALGARYHLRSAAGTRVLDRFALAPGELLETIELPPLPAGARAAFVQYAPTQGSFPLAAAAVIRAPGHAAIALLGAPGRAAAAERALLAGAGARQVAELAADELADPHRRALAAALLREALQ